MPARARFTWFAAVLVVVGLLPAAGGPQGPSGALEASGRTVTLLPDGQWLLLGGQDPPGVLDPRTGTLTPLPALDPPRAGHTATVLADGSVLILGGTGPDGTVLSAPLRLDPATGTSRVLVAIDLTPRTHHSATLLTDGRVLIAGGTAATGDVLAQAEVWSVATGQLDRVTMTTARSGHTATLQPDGSVVVSGGQGVGGSVATDERFDPATDGFSSVGVPPAGDADAPGVQLAASRPATNAVDVPVDEPIALRFTRPLRVTTVTPEAIILTGPRGPEPVRLVPTEAGRLVFVIPETALAPGARYALSITGPSDTTGQPLPPADVSFTTAAPSSDAQKAHAGHAAHASALEDRAHQHRPRGPAVQPGSASELDAFEWMGPRRDGKPHSAWQDLPPLHAQQGVTALAGQVLQLNGQPLADVTLEIGPRAARTDHTGRFLLTDIAPGRQALEMDGSTANQPGRTYGVFSYTTEVAAGTTTALPFTIWMPRLDMQHATPIPVPTTRDIVATTPRIPGLEVHIPADVVLRTYDGPLTALSITQIPVDRPPFPLPEGTTFFFTPQGHGAKVLRPDGSPSPRGIRLLLPNPDGLPPGTPVELSNYDYGEWSVYGSGTVSPDGRQIVPSASVELHRLTCAFLGPVVTIPAPILGGVRVGDPVDAGTGLVTLDKVDLIVPDVVPIVIQRQFRPGQSGWTWLSYQMYLTGDNTTFTFAELVLANGTRVHYDRTSPGTDKASAIMEHTGSPTAFYKSRLTWNATRAGWDLTFANGTVYELSGPSPPAGPKLVGIRDRVGNRLAITRDQSAGITRITSPNGRWVDVTHDATNAFNVTQVKDNLGRTVSYSYDAFFRLTAVTDAVGGVTQYTYDTANHVATITDPRNIVYVTNTYDANGRIIKQTQADGSFYQFAYTLDGSGTVIQTDVTDPRGNVRRLTFNAKGYVLTDTRASGTALAQTITYGRDATSNLVTSVTDALGRQTVYTHDAQGNVLTVTRLAGTPDAVTTTFTYTVAFNQVATVTDPLSHTTTFGYDGVGNLTSVTDPLSHQTTLTYNTAGQPITLTTPAGTTQFGYDRGDLVTITDALGHVTTRFSDGAGRFISLTAPGGQRTRYTYDALNQLTTITDPLGGQTQFSYDGNGNLLSLTDARSNVTSYAYNSMDRPTSRTDPLLHADTFVSDANGNPTTLTDRKSQVTQTTYDALDRPTLVTFHDGSTLAYTWDAGNRLTQVVDSIGGAITRSYDGLDRLTQEGTALGTVSYAYDAAGRRSTMTVGGQPTVSYTYDAADRLTQITQGSAMVGYTYDTANRRTSLTLPNGIVTDYAYDAGSRLTGLTYSLGGTPLGTLTYAHDANGNRTTMGGTWAATGIPQPVAAATYDAANHQLTFAGLTLTYDLNGNLTGDGTHTYTWGARNQLAAVSDTGLTGSFAYDAFGRRQGRTINAAPTQFLYDGLNPVQELAAGTPSATLLTGLGIDEYLTRTDASGGRHFLSDALASTIALTDATGIVTTSYTYEPFGATSLTGAATANALDYTGREDDGTGLKYYRARYYHPQLQRFISEDPIEFGAGDVNLYTYVANVPTGFIDPVGLERERRCSFGDRYRRHLDAYLINVGPAAAGLLGGVWPKSWAPATGGRGPFLGSTNPLTSVPRAFGGFGIPVVAAAAATAAGQFTAASIGVATVGIGYYNVGVLTSGLVYTAFPGWNGLPADGCK